MTIELEGDTWLNNLPSKGLMRGLVSNKYEPGGWMSVVRPGLSLEHFTVLRNTSMALYFRGDTHYDITSPETIAVEVPASATSSGQVPGNVETGFAVATFKILASPGEALLGGGFLNTSLEAAVTSPATAFLTIELLGNTWNPDVGRDKWASRATLDSLLSQQHEPKGWNNVVRPSMRERRNLVRLSDTKLQLTLPQYASYEIRAPETLDVRLPGHLVSAETNVSSPGLLVIRPRPGRASIVGGVLPGATEETVIRFDETTVDVELLDDAWLDMDVNATSGEGTANMSRMEQLLDAFKCDTDELEGWNAEVAPLLKEHGRVERKSDTLLRVTVPAVPGYNISAPETIRLTVPADAVLSRVAPIMDLPAFVIHPQQGFALLEAPAIQTEVSMQSGSGAAPTRLIQLATEGLADVSKAADTVSLNITLSGDEEWSSDLLSYHDEEFEICPEVVMPNATVLRLENISLCAPSPNATNTTNGTCAYVGNSTNASMPETWAWGFPYAYETLVEEVTLKPVSLPSFLTAFLPIGGVGWREAQDHGIEVERPGSNRRRLTSLGGGAPPGAYAMNLTNATNATNVTDACTLYVRRVYSEATQKLLRGIVSAQLEPHGWMRVVYPALTGDMLRKNGSTLTLTLPPALAYNIQSPERLSVKLPRESLLSRRSLTVNNTAHIAAIGGQVGVSGSFVHALREEAIRSPQKYDFVFSLLEESWDAQMGQDNALSSHKFIAGIYSEQNEAGGWNSIVQPQLEARYITRWDDQTATLTLPAFADYEISQPETLRFFFSPETVASRDSVLANVSLTIMPRAGFVTLSGSLLDQLGEGYLRAPPPLVLDLTLHGDTFEENITVPNSTLFHTLVSGFSALTPRVVQLGEIIQLGNVTLGTNRSVQQVSYTGWNDQIQPSLQPELLSENTLRVTLPPAPAYEIFDEEVVEITLAPELVRSRNPPIVRPHLRIKPATAAAYGSLLTPAGGDEYAIQNHSTPARVSLKEPPTLVLVLEAERWSDAVGGVDTNATNHLLQSIISHQNESTASITLSSRYLTTPTCNADQMTPSG